MAGGEGAGKWKDRLPEKRRRVGASVLTRHGPPVWLYMIGFPVTSLTPSTRLAVLAALRSGSSVHVLSHSSHY